MPFRVAAKLLRGASWGSQGRSPDTGPEIAPARLQTPAPGFEAGTAGLGAGALPLHWLFLTPSSQLGAGWPGQNAAVTF